MLATTVNFTFRDSKGKESVYRHRISGGLLPSDIYAYMESAAQIVKNMSAAELTGVSASVSLDLSASTLKTVATQFSDVVNGLLVIGRNAVAGLFAKFKLPTYDDANNADNSDLADAADTDIATLVAILEDGNTNAGITTRAVTTRGEVVDDITSMREIFRKS